VVANGTGAGLTGYGDTHAKTGTAEFQAEDGSIHAHAWTVGFRGDMAFAAMIIGGEDSAKTNQIAAELLATVPA
jgi:cell division protein FtsI/penicillin-binding protein 2